MVILIITTLLLVSLAVVLYPLLLPRAEASGLESDPAEELAERLRRARDRVYEEMRVLQQEHFLHHLTDAEYQERVRTARVRAALLLRQQQRVRETVAGLDRALEAEINRTLGPGQDDAAP